MDMKDKQLAKTSLLHPNMIKIYDWKQKEKTLKYAQNKGNTTPKHKNSKMAYPKPSITE